MITKRSLCQLHLYSYVIDQIACGWPPLRTWVGKKMTLLAPWSMLINKEGPGVSDTEYQGKLRERSQACISASIHEQFHGLQQSLRPALRFQAEKC